MSLIQEQKNNRILIAAFDHVFLEKMNQILTKKSFCIFLTDDGHEAVEMAFDLQPVAIIADAVLKNTDGYSMCKEIRKFPNALREIPIIMLLSKSDLQSRLLAFIAGATRYICKPFGFDELLSTLNSLIVRVSFSQRREFYL